MDGFSDKYRVLELLYRTKRPMTTKEISERLDLPHTSIPISIKRLHHFIVRKNDGGVFTYYIPRCNIESVQKRLNYLIQREGGNFEIDDENRLDTDTE